MKNTLGLFSAAALLVACGTSPSTGDAGSGNDSGEVDSGSPGSDAGTTDSGTPDSGSNQDAGVADSGSADSGCAYRYCEDFEGYDAGAITNGELLGPWKATVTGMGIQARIDAVNPRHGLQSLHITVPADAGTRGTLNQMNALGLVPGNDFFGRAEVFYSDGGLYDLPLGVHSWVFNASGAPGPYPPNPATMNMGGGGSQIQLNYHPGDGGEASIRGGLITAGSWHCLQWEYDGPTDSATVWVDGTLAVSTDGGQGWIFPTPWNSFDFGFTHYQALKNPVDVYLDDFALDGAMIPCPP